MGPVAKFLHTHTQDKWMQIFYDFPLLYLCWLLLQFLKKKHMPSLPYAQPSSRLIGHMCALYLGTSKIFRPTEPFRSCKCSPIMCPSKQQLVLSITSFFQMIGLQILSWNRRYTTSQCQQPKYSPSKCKRSRNSWSKCQEYENVCISKWDFLFFLNIEKQSLLQGERESRF